MTRMRPLWFASLLCAGAMSCAASEPAAHAYTAAPGFIEVPADRLEGEEYYRRERFPEQGGSMFHPDAELAPPVRALLMVGHQDGLLPHARYRVGWQVAADPEAPGQAVDYVEVVRFNLGPARQDDLRASVPAEHLADVPDFGVGADVAWRFVMAPRQGMRAGVVEAARRELREEEAAAADCLGVPCAGLPGPIAPEGTWVTLDASMPPARYAGQAGDGGPHPARVVDELVAAMGEEAGRPVPFDADAPRFVFVVSANAEGQDLMTSALARDAVVFDDAIGTIWARWHWFSGAGPESALFYQPRER